MYVVGCGFPQPKDVGGDGGGSSDDGGMNDAGVDAPPAQCDVFAQTGCPANQKCTWISDGASTPTFTIGCVANGTVADKGACSFSSGPLSFDNCVKGSFCFAGLCATICNPMNATNTCGSTAACTGYSDPPGAGACVPTCNPLDDNSFRQGASKPGTACTAAQGCYGVPSTTSGNPTRFQCAPDLHITNRAVHRTRCEVANTCASAGGPYVNGCSQGYMALLRESTTSTTIVCIAMCKPSNCYSGNCPSAAGVAPHACNTTNAEGTFDPATTANNGDHCMYSWFFENDAGNVVLSPTSNTVGFCVNHKLLQYDTNADGVPDSNLPLCASLPLMGNTDPPYNAGDWGCVDTATAGVQFTGKKRPPAIDLRLPYGWQPPAP
jgi:hypothetical protein